MTNQSTKRALIASILSVAVCISMLIGSTFAWFTDSVTTGANTVTAGNLDIDVQYSADFTAWADAKDATAVFGEKGLWEPGHTEVAYFKITNAGTLALEYKIGTNILENVKGENLENGEIDLSKLIKFGVIQVTDKFADAAAARDGVAAGDFVTTYSQEFTLAAGVTEYFAVVAWMPEETGNAANYKTGTTAPAIKFGINVVATQTPSESDSFGTDYDKNAAWPATPKVENIQAEPKTAEELLSILNTAFTGGSATGTITINLNDDFDLKNSWSTAVSQNYSGVNTVIINGNGHYIKNMNMPLIEGVFGGAGTLTFKNLTIKDSTVSAAGGSGVGIGVFMNNSDSSTAVTFENCHIDNVKITNTADNSTLGGFVGYCSAATLTFKNCSVKNSVFTGTKDIGALVGYTQSAVTADGITVTGNAITSSNTSDYRVGAIAGTFNSNPVAITNATVSDNTVTQANASNPASKKSDYVGRIYTTVTINGETLEKNNG